MSLHKQRLPNRVGGGIAPIGANLMRIFPKDICSVELCERGAVLSVGCESLFHSLSTDGAVTGG